MKYLFKKYWFILLIALCINIPLVVFGTKKTNKSVTLKGDTTIVENFVEIDNPYPQTGSLSTIYVISLDHCTLLQQWMVGASSTSEVSDVPEHYLHFTTAELNQMGRIQYESSINYALLNAYKEAEKVNPQITIEAELANITCAYYPADSEFRIGDQVIGINNIKIETNPEGFITAFNARVSGDTYQVLRNGQEINIAVSDANLFGGYAFYDIKRSSPVFHIKETNVGGPSGGLLQTLALYNSLVPEDITKGRKIAGTGTIELDGSVGPIGGIQQKIYTAFDDDMEIFLCPAENYDEALIAYQKLPNHNMKLYKISTLAEALEVLSHE